MFIIKSRFLPIGRRFSAINLFGLLFVKPYANVTPRLINHERIHTRQIVELLVIGFYILYICEWLFRLILAKGNNYAAYRRISFEREAYLNDKNLDYLSQRKHFAQWRKKQQPQSA